MGSVEPVEHRVVSQAENHCETHHHLTRSPTATGGAVTERPQVRPRRSATDVERRALASSLRLHILRLTADEALTNQEIAARLGRDPATVLHHVRTLVEAGFLAPEPVRRGARGSRERPYRAVRGGRELDTAGDPEGAAAMAEAFVDDLRAARWQGCGLSRIGLRLTEAERSELEGRLTAVLEDFARRPPSPRGQPWSAFLAVYPEAGRA